MTEGQMGASGNYYLWTEKREAVLYRKANSAVTIGMKSNILSEAITMAFKTDLNGPATNIANGIRNNRFALFVNDADGYPAGLKITALGDYDKNSAGTNSDTIVLLSGRIRSKYKYTCIIKGRTTGNGWRHQHRFRRIII